MLPGLSFVFSTFGFAKFVFTVVGFASAFGVIVGAAFGSCAFGVTVTSSRGYNLPSFARTYPFVGLPSLSFTILGVPSEFAG